ncbi:MAG: helix-turn-helix domain-containing protein, partial [Bryobacteraceae bacterium]
AIRQGQFREDLYFRLAGVTLYLPPLRRRAADVPLLVDRFWADLQRRYARPGPAITPEAAARLESAPWPGNVRQLRNTVEKLFVLPRGDQVTAEDVAAALGPQTSTEASAKDGAMSASTLREARRLFEIDYITRQLREHGGNVTRTAAAIGFERQSLQELIKKLGIPRTGN